MKKIIVSICAILYSTFLLGQHHINGRVLSAVDSLPVQNASVSLINGSKVKTDNRGVFSLRFSENDSRIRITHIAFIQKVVKVGKLSGDSVFIFLEPLAMDIKLPAL